MHGRTLAGRYRLDSPLGRGGMGEVWKAADLLLNRTVAVKVMALDRVPEQAVARFRREAEIAAGLQHPGIAVVFDTGTDDGLLFLVMELLAGTDLAEVARRHPHGLPAGRAVGLLAQVADALAEAHDKGIVHRDIKPANVMLLDGDRIKILDFGIARYAEQATDLTGSAVIGTPAFMAPEQFDRGRPVDHRTDLYALGGLAYQLLTGRKPFAADTMPALFHDILLTPAPAVRDARPELPEALDRLVADLLAKDPDDRPPNARTVAERLRAVHPRPQARSSPRTAPAEEAAETIEQPSSDALQAASGSGAAAGTGRRGRRPGGAKFRALVSGGVAVVVFALVNVVVLINPGGRLIDQGAFVKPPGCGEVGPAGFPTDSAYAKDERDDLSDCTWREDLSERRWMFTLYLRKNDTDGWTSAPGVAAKTLAQRWTRTEGTVKRAVPSLGTGAFTYERDGTQVVLFQVSNLVVTATYEQRTPALTYDTLERRTLELVAEVSAKLKR